MTAFVVSGAESFEVADGRTSSRVPWSAVREATVLKFDRYIVDEIGMLLLCDEPYGLVQLSEHTTGFQEFADTMHGRLQACLPYAEWYLFVAFPAFETNARCIYRRGGVPDEAPAMPEAGASPEPRKAQGRLRRWVEILTGF